MTPGFQKVAPKDRGAVPQRSKTAEERVVAADLFLVDRYAFGTLAERGFKYVGVDQLIGGPWPDNEASVSCLDWVSGQPNAKSAPLPTPPAVD